MPFTSEILQLFVSVWERTFPSFHLVVCFSWRSKVSGTEPHKPRRSGVLTLEQFQGHANGQIWRWPDRVVALLGKYQWVLLLFCDLWIIYQISRLRFFSQLPF